MSQKEVIAVFSFTVDGARDKALKLIDVDEQRLLLRNKNIIETDKAIYRLYPHGTQINGIRFHEAYVNDLFTVRYVRHIKQGLSPESHYHYGVHYFMSDDKPI